MKSILLWMGTAEGRLVAALLLYATVWALERAPLVRGWLDGRPTAKRLSAIALTVLPAAAAGLWAGLPIGDVAQTAATAFLVATGINTVVPNVLLKPTPPNVAGLRKAGVLIVLLAGCGLPPASAAKVARCAAQYDACFVEAKLLAGTDEERMASFKSCRALVDAACLDAPPVASAAPSASGAP